MSRGCLAGRPYPRDTCKTQLSPFVLTLRIPVMCKAHALFRGMLNREIPAKTYSVFNSLSFHTLSFYHTTLTIKSYNKYRVQKIEYNYNQIWYRIKANKQHLCKSQLYMVKVCNRRCRQFIEPYPCCSPKGCWKCLANNFIWGLLEAQNCFESSNVVQKVFSAIIDL